MAALLNSLNSDNQHQLEYYHERIDLTQRQMILLNHNILKLTHKASKVRDVGDEIAQNLLDFATKDADTIKGSNSMFMLNMKQYAYCLLAIEDHRDSNIECVNSKVISEIALFIENLKYNKNHDFKNLLEMYNKELPKKKGLINNLINNRNINNNNNNCNEANSSDTVHEETLIKSKMLHEKIAKETENFEKKKNNSIQEILKKFTLSQINFHSQAVQLYTNAYQCLINTHVQHDLKRDINKIGKNLYSSNLEVDLEGLINHLNQINNARKINASSENISQQKLVRKSPSKPLSNDSIYSSSTSSLCRNSITNDSNILGYSPIIRNNSNSLKIERPSSNACKLSHYSLKTVERNLNTNDTVTAEKQVFYNETAI